MGIKDANNMGAAMAPAALDTLITHFQDTGRKPSYYDLIITGDLGYIGKDILTDLAKTKGYNIKVIIMIVEFLFLTKMNKILTPVVAVVLA